MNANEDEAVREPLIARPPIDNRNSFWIKFGVLIVVTAFLSVLSLALTIEDNNLQRGVTNCADFRPLGSQITRLVLLVLALFSLLYVFYKKKFHNVRVPNEGNRNENWSPRAVLDCIPELDWQASMPSTFLLTVCILLGLFDVVGQGIKFIDGILQLTSDKSECSGPNFWWILDKFVIPFLQVVFTILQTIFFAVCGNRGPNKFSAILFSVLMAPLIATNLASWFSSVNSEVLEHFNTHSKCNNSVPDTILPYVFPFSAEYSILCTIFGLFCWINMGNLAKQLLREHPVNNEDELQQLLNQNLHARAVIPDTVAHYWFGLGFGQIPLTVAIISILFFWSLNQMDQYILFYTIMMILHIANAIALIYFLWVGHQNQSARHPRSHGIDIFMLCTAAACDIICNVFLVIYNFISSRNPTRVHFDDSPANNSAPFIVALIDVLFCIADSGLQLLVLILALNYWTFHDNSNLYGLKQCSVAMMLINFSEWLMFTFCSSQLIVDADSVEKRTSATLIVSIICSPLSIFYRFHSVGCFNELRGHLAEVELMRENMRNPDAVRLQNAAEND